VEVSRARRVFVLGSSGMRVWLRLILVCGWWGDRQRLIDLEREAQQLKDQIASA